MNDLINYEFKKKQKLEYFQFMNYGWILVIMVVS